MTNQYTYSAGKRKTAVACVKLYDEGKGEITINSKKAKDYFTPLQIENAIAPLALLDRKSDFDIVVRVQGGGKESQSDAMRHGISRALLLIDPDVRTLLKREGFLRRDARVKERKKPGLKSARRAPQFSKR
ncbi:30S ribosomal protein S9 [Candidatus Peregrinibacteria bacterium]|jgi:small subunit ribosomal protein S9|nr:30S ribosomal protein S9 [Candidatus Peregrinibacteria bacterium]MBT3599100.1 30S ribosomal protein S9 [Candidatus Peregrinibacteria bacterium]MBT4367665.1 30S ribosomal protein S9 [Candidatus Peregrinibacteria bacterium]MBT4585443.1 30S ribosomal protein S9 [Candidatus Peregrinibacteria bacterium]MBT6730406.1 30S ribosomal protein S9 [Candidatus Peregrinibacteria bacterium]